MQIKDLDLGSIVWKDDLVLGVKGLTLESVFGNLLDNSTVSKVLGNPYDYEINKWSIPDAAQSVIDKLKAEQED